MTITIDGKDIELNFGIRFLRELNEKHNVVMDDGSRLGIGVEYVVPRLYLGDIDALEDAIYCACWGEKKRPTRAQLDDYIDSAGDIDALFGGVMNELKNQNATRQKALAAVAAIEQGASPAARQKAAATISRSTRKR